MTVRHILSGTALLAGIVACGGSAANKTDSSAAPAATPTTTAAASGPQTPDPGHKVIVIEAMTDDQGNNVFKPAKLEAHRGDVLRFTLKSGVHNVHFLPDSNPGKSGLPPRATCCRSPVRRTT